MIKIFGMQEQQTIDQMEAVMVKLKAPLKNMTPTRINYE